MTYSVLGKNSHIMINSEKKSGDDFVKYKENYF